LFKKVHDWQTNNDILIVTLKFDIFNVEMGSDSDAVVKFICLGGYPIRSFTNDKSSGSETFIASKNARIEASSGSVIIFGGEFEGDSKLTETFARI
jgi:hypothetical protein